MAGKKTGYARVSTLEQDLIIQREALLRLGVTQDRIYVDHGLTGAHRVRPGLPEAMAVCWPGDLLVVAKLDRLVRSVPDTRDIADELTAKEVVLPLGGNEYDSTGPAGQLLFNALSMVAEFESNLIRLRTREGMATARAKGRLRGKRSKLSGLQWRHLMVLRAQGELKQAELFGVTRSMIYRTIQPETIKSTD